MGENARREIKITLKGDTDTMDSVEESLREVLEAAKDEQIKSTFVMTKETLLEEEEPTEEGEEDEVEDDDDFEEGADGDDD